MGTSPVQYSILPRDSEEGAERAAWYKDNKAKTINVTVGNIVRVLGLICAIVCVALAGSSHGGDYFIAIFSVSLVTHAIDLLVSLTYNLLHPHTGKDLASPRRFHIKIVVTNPRTGESTDWRPLQLPGSLNGLYTSTRYVFDAALIICLIVAVVLVSKSSWGYWNSDARVAATVLGSIDIVFHFVLLFPMVWKPFFVFGFGLNNGAQLDTYNRPEPQQQYRDDPTTEDQARTEVDV